MPVRFDAIRNKLRNKKPFQNERVKTIVLKGY